jgi:hypothetical protein
MKSKRHQKNSIGISIGHSSIENKSSLTSIIPQDGAAYDGELFDFYLREELLLGEEKLSRAFEMINDPFFLVSGFGIKIHMKCHREMTFTLLRKMVPKTSYDSPRSFAAVARTELNSTAM